MGHICTTYTALTCCVPTRHCIAGSRKQIAKQAPNFGVWCRGVFHADPYQLMNGVYAGALSTIKLEGPDHSDSVQVASMTAEVREACMRMCMMLMVHTL